MTQQQDYNAHLKQLIANDSAKSFNYLKPQNVKFVIGALPEVSFAGQAFHLPKVSVGFAEQRTPLIDIPTIGDKLHWDYLPLQFIIDEKMDNYVAIFNWIINIAGKDMDSKQLETWRRQTANFPQSLPLQKEARFDYSDAVMMVLDAQNNVVREISYTDVFPISIETVPFDITKGTQEPQTAVANFRYGSYTFN